MRYAILSDIHANLDALETVVRAVEKEGVDTYLCLGDIVGYGACPRECLEIVQSLASKTVAGNHDYAALGKIEVENFNVYAKEAAHWTRDHLDAQDLEFLGSLPLVEHFENFSIAHGTLSFPELFDYIHSSYDAQLSLMELPGEVCFLGHSHIPVSFIRRETITYSLESEIQIAPGTKSLINVGSVGQPRDNNPQASFAIFDTERRTVWIRRVSYDYDQASSRIKAAGLPVILGERLKLGR